MKKQATQITQITLSPTTNRNGEIVYRSPGHDLELQEAFRREQLRQAAYRRDCARNASDSAVSTIDSAAIATELGKGAVSVLRFTAKAAWATVRTIGVIALNIGLDQVARAQKRGSRENYYQTTVQTEIEVTTTVVTKTTITKNQYDHN